MTKLTDTQLIILSQAVARDDGCAVMPEGKKAAGALKAGASLIGRKLMKEVRSKPDLPVWRTDDENRSISLVLTAAGRKAIGVAEDEPVTEEQAKKPRSDVPRTTRRARPAQPASATASSKRQSPAAARSCEVRPFREDSKQALVVKMLSAKAGTTIDALVEATGWLPHTTRAALTGLRKRGLAITREGREGKPSLYRIEPAGRAA